MQRTTPSRGSALPAAVLALGAAAVIAIAASGVLGNAGDPADPSPTAPPVATPRPSLPSTPAPSAPADGEFEIDLENLLGDDVSVLIDDEIDVVDGATSGHPGDGMSVRWGEVKVENLDSDTLRIVWVGLPGDEQVKLSVSKNGSDLRLRLVDKAPPPNSDGLGYDRILILDLNEDVRAEDVQATIQNSIDTQD